MLFIASGMRRNQAVYNCSMLLAIFMIIAAALATMSLVQTASVRGINHQSINNTCWQEFGYMCENCTTPDSRDPCHCSISTGCYYNYSGCSCKKAAFCSNLDVVDQPTCTDWCGGCGIFIGIDGICACCDGAQCYGPG